MFAFRLVDLFSGLGNTCDQMPSTASWQFSSGASDPIEDDQPGQEFDSRSHDTPVGVDASHVLFFLSACGPSVHRLT